MSRNIETLCKRERYEDIGKRANISEDMVRYVIKSEYDSYMQSLCSGEKVVIPGVCTIEPVVKDRIGNSGQSEKYVTVKIHPSGVMLDKLNEVDNFKLKKINKDNIEVDTIQGLQ